ncbi:MAG: nickel pincer cofactor biosynthesis protein LarB [Blastocatellales bacterium]|nr:nickel pincer cofactor biosynthesis protein LarB [Blastocatellales bacterium]
MLNRTAESDVDKDRLRELLFKVRSGEVPPDDALERLRHLPFEDLGYARIDHHRALRQGFPEVIFGQGKTPEQIAGIAERLLDRAPNLLITRTDRAAFEMVRAAAADAEFHDACGAITVTRDRSERGRGTIAVVTAGTSDIAVAEEAAVTAEILGNRTARIYDVGVAGIHRILSQRELLQSAKVIVCVAGMEGALPSVVGGLVGAPVIAVPTSVGYGASFGGIAALLGMLNSCASNVAVVNIDNGFGAGFVAGLINRREITEQTE